ncbi:hypothetical protein Ddye_022260 [Dipteronia dyeriana]|uniref:tyrosine--tRNA ligase n=1 Tax=Dipteronia dyeriana TaxID=168575 RepID=A0AAD9U461_9ROSI|nr:hypothetical protein Ddye_022260 [Dipteronia dyeriana]
MNSLSLQASPQVSLCAAQRTLVKTSDRIGDICEDDPGGEVSDCGSVGEECIQEDELLNLLTKKPEPIFYDRFEPTGRMHIAQGVMKTTSVNKSYKMTSAGCKVKIWVEDWFALQCNKMGGDLKKIQAVGRYLIETWKAAGMNLNGVEFIWSSEEIFFPASEYWPLVMDIARSTDLPLITSNEQDELSAASIIYPCMQCAEIFFLKSIVNLKIKKAYCPSKIVQGNPCLEYIKFIIFPRFSEFKVERSAANGGDKTYTSHEELIAVYAEEKLHPADLKPALSKALNKILQIIAFSYLHESVREQLLYIAQPYPTLSCCHIS